MRGSQNHPIPGIAAHGVLAFEHAVLGELPLDYVGRSHFKIVGVVAQDAGQVVRVPRVNPLAGELQGEVWSGEYGPDRAC